MRKVWYDFHLSQTSVISLYFPGQGEADSPTVPRKPDKKSQSEGKQNLILLLTIGDHSVRFPPSLTSVRIAFEIVLKVYIDEVCRRHELKTLFWFGISNLDQLQEKLFWNC